MHLHLIGEIGVFDLFVKLFAGRQFLCCGSKAVDADELERLDKMLRFQVAQKLTKHAKRS